MNCCGLFIRLDWYGVFYFVLLENFFKVIFFYFLKILNLSQTIDTTPQKNPSFTLFIQDLDINVVQNS